VSLLSCFLLASCFVSARFEIPSDQIVQPEGLAGRYWNLADAPERLGIEEFAFTEEGGVTLTQSGQDDDDESGEMHGRLVSLLGDEIFLFILDSDDEFQYLLLERRGNGAWVMADIELNNLFPFSQLKETHAADVAGKYRLTLSNGESDRIEGEINAENVLGLFRDPDFLGAINYDVTKIYLPMHNDRERAENLDIVTGPVHGPALTLAQPLETLQGAVRPEGLAGRYFYRAAYRGDEPEYVRIIEKSDGRFEVWRGLYWIYDFLLVPLKDGKDRFVGLIKARDGADQGPHTRPMSLVYLQRRSSGFELAQIQLRFIQASPAIAQMRTDMVREAASRHGLSMTGSTLDGLTDADQLQSLFDDGQFVSGIELNWEWKEDFISEDAISRNFRELVDVPPEPVN